MSDIGSKIKSFRNIKGYTQKDLAAGNCSQSELSKIENNKLIPSLEICLKLATKLNLEIDQLIKVQHTIDISKELQIIVRLFYEKKFKECYDLVLKIQNLIDLDLYEQIILYIKSACEYIISKNVDSLINLEKALMLTYTDYKKKVYPIEIQLLNIIGYIYININPHKAQLYLNKSIILIASSTEYNIHSVAFSKCYYTFAQYYISQGNFIKAEAIVSEGITWCLNNKTLFYLEDLYKLNYDIYNHLDMNKLKKNISRKIFAISLINKDIAK